MRHHTLWMLSLGLLGITTLNGCSIVAGAMAPELSENSVATMLLPSVALGAKMRRNDRQDSWEYNGTRDARIRLYHKNSAGSFAYADTVCKPGKKARKVEVGTGLTDQMRSLTNSNKNIKLGMPETEYSRRIFADKQLLGHRFYREWAVEGGHPVTVGMSDLHVGNRMETSGGMVYRTRDKSCQNRVYFTPQAGVDYEVEMSTLEEGRCGMRVMKLLPKADGRVKVEEVPTSACGAE